MRDKNLATNQGVPVADNQNSLTVGQRGPVLLQDVHLIEKLAHRFNSAWLIIYPRQTKSLVDVWPRA